MKMPETLLVSVSAADADGLDPREVAEGDAGIYFRVHRDRPYFRDRPEEGTAYAAEYRFVKLVAIRKTVHVTVTVEEVRGGHAEVAAMAAADDLADMNEPGPDDVPAPGPTQCPLCGGEPAKGCSFCKACLSEIPF